jgi:hypothetical protein
MPTQRLRTECRTEGGDVLFVVRDLPELYHAAASTVGFEPVAGGLARRFPASGLYLERAYANFTRLLDEYLQAEAGERPTSWDAALEAFLQAIEGQDVNWFLVGSASLSVRGLPVTPGDIDLVTDGAGARRLGELLVDSLIEPVIPVTGWICAWWGRAYLGARVEWVGDVDASVDLPEPADFGPVAASRLETIVWRGHPVRVPPLDLMLGVSERRGRAETAAAIREAMRQGGS